MRRRDFIVAALAAASSHPAAALAQPVAKTRRVALLMHGSPATDKEQVEAFLQALGALGRSEGSGLAIERRFAEGKPERLPALAEELVRTGPDVILAPTRLATEAARKATRTIPIVFCMFPDPVGAGVVASLARPGGNATGVSHILIELTAKRLEALRSVTPRLARLGALGAGDVTSRDQLAELQRIAPPLGVELVAVEAGSKERYEEAFARLKKAGVDGVFVLGSIINFSHRQVIGELVVRHRMPSVHTTPEYVVAGGLIGYAPDTVTMFRRAATYVDRILKGDKPAELPVELPTVFQLTVNLRTARALGLTIPQSVLLRADRVIE